ncbi:PRC-barrel domain containing protein [Caulobacter segnis]|uniref:PRC-barrel domain containing protein n=1 Tax=Caulobacter segnis TaxID=88688 RepID=UPI00240EF7D7|nr:PRC-barrel domain containing protein [Caulobacter segnis]MDG2520379.1 PRC-barrel domain containing protein [Caulobacter segnis]
MSVTQAAGWIAPAATMIAAVMTAANLGARVTGCGFIVFLVGSMAWIAVALSGDQQNLLWTNGFLTVVNAVGVWRWLGRQARYEQGGAAASRKSAASRAPTLFPAGGLAGARLLDPDGRVIGSVVDAMLRCDDLSTSYVVVSEGGLVGLGERLHALAVAGLTVTDEGVRCELAQADLKAMTPLGSEWPARAPSATTSGAGGFEPAPD